MGMPVSVALRGRHAADHVGADAWAAVMDELRWVDDVFSTYRPGSWVSRLGRGEVAVADCPPEVQEVLDLGRAAERAVRRRVRRLAHRRGGAGAGPERGGEGLGRRAGRRRAAGPGRHRLLPLGRRRPGLPHPRPGGAAVEHRRRGPARPGRLLAACRSAPGRWPPPAPPTAARTWWTPAPARPRTGSPRSPSSRPRSPGRTSTRPRRTHAAPTRPDWLRTRPGRTGVVVWSDGSAELVDARAVRPAAR